MSKTILVIDDDADFVGLVATVLGTHDCMVIGHPTGVAAKARVKAVRPDLVILDLWLPGKSGWDVLAALRQDPSTAQVPIVVCTAMARDPRATAETIRDLGAGFIAKPFDLDDLLSTVGSALGLECGTHGC